MPSAIRYLLQALAYAAFAAFIGYFSTAPAYRQLDDNQALLKLSFSHGAQLKEKCRERGPAELAKLAPNMRARFDCPRERSLLIVEIDMDGKPLYRIEAPPSGLRHDGPSIVYRRLAVTAGKHHFRARLADGPDGVLGYEREANVELAPGRVLIVDFVPQQGGFVFTGG
jgi:hypothetical protein